MLKKIETCKYKSDAGRPWRKGLLIDTTYSERLYDLETGEEVKGTPWDIEAIPVILIDLEAWIMWKI